MLSVSNLSNYTYRTLSEEYGVSLINTPAYKKENFKEKIGASGSPGLFFTLTAYTSIAIWGIVTQQYNTMFALEFLAMVTAPLIGFGVTRLIYQSAVKGKKRLITRTLSNVDVEKIRFYFEKHLGLEKIKSFS